jgi:hypothetical protein
MMDEFTELQNGVNKLGKLPILLITLETQYIVKKEGAESLKNDKMLLITLKNLINI